MSSAWYLKCFGSARATRGEQIVERFRTQKTASLLALLALRGPQNREAVCALLWPESPPEAARNSLSSSLSALRRDLGAQVLDADRNRVALAAGALTTDVAEFDAALNRGDWTHAVELFKGPLLPGFYDEPFPALAREYEEKARHAFSARLRDLENSATHGNEVPTLARRAIALFGNDERWFLALMRTHRQSGDTEAALRAYDGLQRWNSKNGEATSETARQLAKSLRRQREESKNAVPADVYATSSEAGKPSVSLVHLPPQWTRFFGRQAERDVLGDWLSTGEKLITLSGPGGSGKTRLMIEAARHIACEQESSERICFVPLVSLSDVSLLLSSIREALGLAVAPDLPPLEQLERALRGQRCLLLLDNFEQLLPEGAAILQVLREKLPQASFVVTSRVLLRLPGERELTVAPLPTPLPSNSLAQVLECPSASLFCDRAGLRPDENNADAIGTLCRRLDGIPLAIELAAARAKVLAPAQILERLERHPDFLQSRELGVPARHKTLRTAIEWSADLLSQQQRDFFVRLCVFRGGWTLEAAEAIAAPGVCEEWEALDLLAQLRECSLILTTESSLGTRFRMLEMLREWGQSQLGQATRFELEQRHCTFYTALAVDELAALGASERELANFRASLNFALAQPSASDAARRAGALDHLWESRALFLEGQEWTARALRHAQTIQAPEVPPQVLARLLLSSSRMQWYAGSRVDARESLRQALSLYESLGDEDGQAQVLALLGRPEEADKSKVAFNMARKLAERQSLQWLQVLEAAMTKHSEQAKAFWAELKTHSPSQKAREAQYENYGKFPFTWNW